MDHNRRMRRDGFHGRATGSLQGALAALVLVAPLAASAECPHPFMPMRYGTTWVYSVTTGEKYAQPQRRTLTVRVENIERNAEGDLVTLSSSLSGTDLQGQKVDQKLPAQAFQCGPKGIAAPMPADEDTAECPTGSSCARTGGKSRIKVQTKEGVFLPPPEALQQGASWTDTFAYQVTPPSATSATKGRPGSGRRESRKTVTSVEMVKTPLGDVEAIKVTDDEKVTMPFQPQVFTRTTVSWYAKRVGLVRTVDGERVTELVSFTPGR